MPISVPTVFISYSWTNDAHQKKVVQFAENLTSQRVDVRLDVWDLKPGHDISHFMEQMVSDKNIDKVIIFSDKEYARKANSRDGGVGSESQIISSEIYNKTKQNKFVVVVDERDENNELCIPIYAKQNLCIDLSDDSKYVDEYERLVRWIYDKPYYKKPALADKPPAFLEEDNLITINTGVAHRRLVDAIKSARLYMKSALDEYFHALLGGLKEFRIPDEYSSKSASDFRDEIVKSIEAFQPYRDELVEVFVLLARYSATEEIAERLHRFFEDFYPYIWPEDGFNSRHNILHDNYKFFLHEAFLCCVAAFLKEHRFTVVSYLTTHKFHIVHRRHSHQKRSYGFDVFYPYLESLNEGRRDHLREALIKKRCLKGDVTLEHLMQADFILYVRQRIGFYRGEYALNSSGYEGKHWFPIMLSYCGYREASFEVIQRAGNREFLNKLLPIFGVESLQELANQIRKLPERERSVKVRGFDSIDVERLLMLDELGSS